MGTFIKSFLAAAVLVAASVAPGHAGSVRVGTLVCDIEGGAGFVFGSRKALGCDFKNLFGPNEYYDGSITKVGIDAGLTGGTRLIWAVLAPTSAIDQTALEGRYYGVTAEASAAVGLGANVLIGGFDRSINLQPLSIQGQLGVNIAAGLAAMRLKSPPQPPIVRKR